MKFINIVSGKGGTGKTLVAATLAEMLSRVPKSRVLLIDMDIFVRGLTSLLYLKYENRRRLLEKGELSVADILMDTKSPLLDNYDNSTGQNKEYHSPSKPGIHRFREFDIWPAVSLIDEILDHNDIMPANFESASLRIDRLKQFIQAQDSHNNYDFVILDSRAGYDELVAATHSKADVSINVEDDDPVSRVTATNLVSQLNQIAGPPIYRLVNKSRNDVPLGTDLIGVIPFDVDIMNSYGSDEFWSNIKKSLLEPALARAWNRLSVNEHLGSELKSNRRSPIQSEAIEIRLSRMSLYQRVLIIYGLLIGLGGIIYGIAGNEILSLARTDPIRLISIGAGVAGFMLTAVTMFSRSLK